MMNEISKTNLYFGLKPILTICKKVIACNSAVDFFFMTKRNDLRNAATIKMFDEVARYTDAVEPGGSLYPDSICGKTYTSPRNSRNEGFYSSDGGESDNENITTEIAVGSKRKAANNDNDSNDQQVAIEQATNLQHDSTDSDEARYSREEIIQKLEELDTGFNAEIEAEKNTKGQVIDAKKDRYEYLCSYPVSELLKMIKDYGVTLKQSNTRSNKYIMGYLNLHLSRKYATLNLPGQETISLNESKKYFEEEGSEKAPKRTKCEEYTADKRISTTSFSPISMDEEDFKLIEYYDDLGDQCTNKALELKKAYNDNHGEPESASTEDLKHEAAKNEIKHIKLTDLMETLIQTRHMYTLALEIVEKKLKENPNTEKTEAIKKHITDKLNSLKKVFNDQTLAFIEISLNLKKCQ